MELIDLGKHDPIQVSRVVHGAMAPRIGIGPDSQRAALCAALDAGITSIDTAPLYDFGGSERLVGEVIAGRREGLQVLSKVGLRWDSDHGRVILIAHGSDGRERTVRCDSRPEAVRRDVEESLERLGIDVIDLVQVHHPDEQTPIAETMGELLRLRSEGKLRAIGVSNFSALQVREAQQALGSVALASHQLRYHLLERDPEIELLPLALELGSGVLAYSPLARGWLGGNRSVGLRQSGLRKALALLRETAARHKASPAQIALAWSLAQPGLSAVIVGASAPEQAVDSAGAVQIKLEAQERTALGTAFSGIKIDERPGLAQRTLRRAKRLASRAKRLVERKLHKN